MSTPKTPCSVKLDLLIKYVASLEKLKIARLEHGEILAVGLGMVQLHYLHNGLKQSRSCVEQRE